MIKRNILLNYFVKYLLFFQTTDSHFHLKALFFHSNRLCQVCSLPLIIHLTANYLSLSLLFTARKLLIASSAVQTAFSNHQISSDRRPQNWYHFLSLYLFMSWCDACAKFSACAIMAAVCCSSSLTFSPRSCNAWGKSK